MIKDFKELIDLVTLYNPDEIGRVKKAYELACRLHSGQFRQSGEPYIVHPLNVCYTLAQLQADGDTLCAGLLHDTLEDTSITKEDIAEMFNKSVANLVDGVTKISKMNFSSTEEMDYANTRKIITSITEDVRTIIIKLADRLHNMRTLQYKAEFKQKENALETLEIFVPLSYYLGQYRIKNELEDLSFKYLKPDIYQKISETQESIEREMAPILTDMLLHIQRTLEDEGIPNEIKFRIKNIYGIYKSLKDKHNLLEIHDLLALKILVGYEEDCYRALYHVHKLYPPLNGKFKDFIATPKTNMYQSLHTTVFAPNERLVQTQIRTFDMDSVASYGITSYWAIKKGEARTQMQEDLKNKFQFFKSLVQINSMFSDNQEFVSQVKSELFSQNVYFYSSKGEIIQLPKGATIIDYAYVQGETVGDSLVGAIVNEQYVNLDYQIKNNDRVKLIVDRMQLSPQKAWLDKAQTAYAIQKIRGK